MKPHDGIDNPKMKKEFAKVRKQFKKKHGGFPATVFVKKETSESGDDLTYFLCSERLNQVPMVTGEEADVAVYTFSYHTKARSEIKLKD